MSPQVRRWFARRTSPIRKPRTARLYLEPLEDRTLLAVSIFGSVWQDLNADGARASEPGLAGITVFIDDGSHAFNGTQPHVLTNGSGDYNFSDLAPGNYSVGVALQAGQSLTSPSPEAFLNVAVPAAGAVEADFGVLASPVVPDNEQVTSDASVQQMPSVAVNPLNANHVVMAYMDYGLPNANGYAGIGISVSKDGGATWTTGTHITLPSGYDQAAGHPTLRFDADGSLYVSFMAATFLGKDSNGASLKPATIYDTATQAVSYLGKTVSRRAFGMQANNGLFLARSGDGGETWDAPVAVSAQRYDATFTQSATAVAAGAGRVVTPAQMPSGMFVGKAFIIDEGLATQERVIVTAFDTTSFTATFAKNHAAGFTISAPVFFDAQPDFVIDTSSTGNMYMVWTRFYPPGTFPERPTALTGSEIMFAVSTNHGQTWTTLRQSDGFSVVKDPLSGTATGNTEGAGLNTLPRITVDSAGGIYVSQFASNRFPVFYSSNGGVSFRAPNPNSSTGAPGGAPYDFTGYPFGLDDVRYTSLYVAGAASTSFLPRSTLFNNSFRTQAVRSIVADPTRPGHVYAVEAVQIQAPDGSVIDSGEITFSRSTDYGLTWSTQFSVGPSAGNKSELSADQQFRYRGVLNDDNAGRFTGFDSTLADEVISGQALPQLSVDSQGNIAVIWYDTRRDPSNTRLDVYGTVSTDGGLTFSANGRISSSNFLASNGAFTDARGVSNPLLGDRIGLALANGQAYAAWTATGSQAGNQDIVFSRYALVPPPVASDDRFEANDDPASAADLGKVSGLRVVPRLALAAGNEDWFRVQAGATGSLVVTVSAPAGTVAAQLELWDATGMMLLASGTGLTAGGLSGQKASFAALSNQVFLVRVAGAAPSYSLSVQSLTADLGAKVEGGVDGSLSAGSSALYRLATPVGGSLGLNLQAGDNVTGALNIEALLPDGQTVVASLQKALIKGESGQVQLPVDANQELLLRISGVASRAVLINGQSFNLALGVPGPALLFTQTGTVNLSLQATGNRPMKARVNTLNSAGAVIATNDLTIQPNAATALILNVPANAGYQVQALEPAGAGSFHLDYTNLDLFETPNSASLLFPVGGSSSSVTTADVNDDGHPDLILTSTQGGDLVRVMLGNADGTFQPPRAYDVGSGQFASSAREPVLADFDGDRALDLVVPNYFSADVSLLKGNGDGTFAPQARYDSVFRASSAATGDFNGDGKLDLAVLDRTAGSAKLVILEGRGDGSFMPPVQVPAAALAELVRGDAYPVRVGDLDGDHDDDLIVFGPNDGLFQPLLNDGTGSFTQGATVSSREVFLDAQLADLNGDGHLDVVVGGSFGGNVLVYLGDGHGTFQQPQSYSTAPFLAGDNVLIVGLAIGDFGGTAGRGAPDGLLDVVVTTRSRNGADVPQMYMLAGIQPGADGKALSPARKLATLKEPGRIAAGDFDGDGTLDIALTQSSGVRILYGSAPAIPANTTKATATDLGTVMHSLSPTRAIVTGFTDSWYKLTVPTESAAGAGDQVLDFSAGFAAVQGAGLQMEVLDENNVVIGSGDRFRVRVPQGKTLFVHIFAKPPAGGGARGAGLYNLAVTVLPQVVGVEGHSVVPGVGGAPGGPTTSLVVTFQGDRLDAAAQDANNYVITWLGADGKAGTADDRVIQPRTASGANPVLYSPGTNVDVTTGRTVPSAVKQTVTILFDEGLPEGSYQIEFKPELQAAPFNATEASLLSSQGTYPGLPLVSRSGPTFAGGETRTFVGLVKKAGPPAGFEEFKKGTPWLAQLHADLNSLLDSQLGQFGDAKSVTDALLQQVMDKVLPGIKGRPESFLILVFDPVSIDVVDPRGERATVDLKTNTVTNNQARTFIQAGGNVEVMVLAGVSGSYTVNLSDVQETARAGAVLVRGGQAEAVSLTPELRGGERTFVFDFGDQAVITTSTTSSGLGTGGLDSSLALAAGLQAVQALAGQVDGTNVDLAAGFADARIGQFNDGMEFAILMGGEETSLESEKAAVSPDMLAALRGLQVRVQEAGKKLAADLTEASEMGGSGDLLGFGNKAAEALAAALKGLGAEAADLMGRFPGLFLGGSEIAAPAGPAPVDGDAEAAAQVADEAPAQPEGQPLDDAGLVQALGLAAVVVSGLHLGRHRKEEHQAGQRRASHRPAG